MIEGNVLALSGGVGGAKLAWGLAQVLPPEKLVIVANTGDDFEHFGLHISPDVDTLLYTLAGINHPQTGWGRSDETWACMKEMEALGGETWFRLGDKDLALHLYRTARLNQGATLSEVVDELRERFQVRQLILPMSDELVRTQIISQGASLSFQHYFVREQCKPVVESIHYEGATKARLCPRLTRLLASQYWAAIVLCPSNPYLSIAPILEIPDVRRALTATWAPIIAVSPIVAGESLKGPAAKLMTELGFPVSPVTVAQYYKGLIHGMVLDEKDREDARKIEEIGISCRVTNIIMNSLEDKMRLAEEVLTFAGRLGRTKPLND